MRLDVDDALIRRYLLGTLPEPEAEALETEYLARPEVLEQVRGMEDDLLDDYAADRLGADERQALESRYLASPRLRDRVIAAQALRLAALPAPQAAARAPLAIRWRWRAPMAIAAGMLLAVMALWFARRPPERTAASPPLAAQGESPAPLPTPGASAPTSPTPPPAPATARLAFALSPLLLRGEQGPRELRVTAGAEAIVLELEGDPALLPPAGTALQALIQTVEGAPVWRGPARRAGNRARQGLLASVQLPAGRLVAGDYLLALTARGETLHRYFFRIRTR